MTIYNRPPETHVPQHIIARLADRSIRMVARHRDKHAAIASLETSFIPMTLEFLDMRRASIIERPVEVAALLKGNTSISGLAKQISVWADVLMNDIRGFDRSVFHTRTAVPDELLTRAEDLMEIVSKHQASSATPLAYGDELLSEIGAALETAKREWFEAQDVLAAQQERQAEVKRLAAEIQQGLVALRRTLRVVIGRAHRDYQKLRVARAKELDDEDPEVEAGAAKAGDPVPSNKTPSSTTEPASDTDQPDA